MKIVRPEVKEILQEEGLQGIYKSIEQACRTCYKSENLIQEGSAEKMVKNLTERKHYSPMEFGTVYLTVVNDNTQAFENLYTFYGTNNYSRVKQDGDKLYITTNYRVLIENNRLSDLQYLSNVTKFHVKRRFVKMILDRGISHEFVRHRVFSFCQESTRYCAYNKDKFGNEITVIKPCFGDRESDCYKQGKQSCESAETTYMSMLSQGVTPEQARTVLPNSLKTELCMCGFESDGEHFFELRCDSKAHPQAKELADMIRDIIR